MAQQKTHLTEEQQSLIQSFMASYNAIDRELRHRLGLDQYQTFSRVVDAYSEQNQYWPHRNELKTIAELRNFLVHNQTVPYQHLAVPTEAIVERIETINSQLAKRVVPRFQSKVTALRSDQSLAELLALVDRNEYSQFPVYDQEDNFLGLITENAITRWLARHVTSQLALVDFQDVAIGVVLQSAEYSTNYHFIARGASVDEAFAHFARDPLLEAVLITHSGKSSQALLGIITRWDVLAP